LFAKIRGDSTNLQRGPPGCRRKGGRPTSAAWDKKEPGVLKRRKGRAASERQEGERHEFGELERSLFPFIQKKGGSPSPPERGKKRGRKRL